MKNIYKILFSVTITVFSLLVIGFVSLTNVKTTTTGNFILIGGYFGLAGGLTAFLVSFVYVYEREWKKPKISVEAQLSPKEKWALAFADLFRYLMIPNIDYTKVYRASHELVYASRELGPKYNIKFRGLYQQNAEDRVVHFAEYTLSEIKHRKAHTGADYVSQMEEDLKNGRIDAPSVVDGALKFLTDMKPYGDIAEDLQRVFHKAIR